MKVVMKREALRPLPCLLAAIVPLLPVRAQEWTRFHGSGGTALAPGIPAKFGESDFAWKAELPGNGVSSPVAWGQRVFVTSETESGGRALLCYDLAGGKLQWKLDDKFEAHGKHRFNSFASSTPVVDAERVYLTWTSGGNFLALAADHEGRKQWQVDLGAYAEDHGSGASPVLAGGVLVVVKDSVGADGFLAGLSPADGRTLWKVARKSDRTPFSTPVTFEESPGVWRVIFSSNPAALTCLDPATGKVIWQHDNPQPEQRPVSSPVIADGVCFATVGQGGKANAAVAVRIKDGSLAWEGGKGLPYVPTPVSSGKHFFLLSDGGILSSVEAATGKQLWSERVFSDQAYSSPVHTGDRIVCISRSGKVAVVAANPDSFQLLGSSELGDPCDATPALAGGRLVIRTARRLLCLTGSRPQP
ncbi:MAG: hypothetical protein RLZZ179_1443 [Verrucomicrobiota bacterium]|jgi:outer membrane protein assembly factor BamB